MTPTSLALIIFGLIILVFSWLDADMFFDRGLMILITEIVGREQIRTLFLILGGLMTAAGILLSIF